MGAALRRLAKKKNTRLLMIGKRCWQSARFGVSPLTYFCPAGLDAAGKSTILYKLKLGEV